MIVVTGGAGFIGSNLVKGLNTLGYQNILVVDDLTDGRKFKNLVDAKILDYQDYEDFFEGMVSDVPLAEPIEAIFHEGACSDTTEWDGHYLMRNNYEYSKGLLHYCVEQEIPFIYASSAAVYGGGGQPFSERGGHERPLNVYGYSKWLFDQYVLRLLPNIHTQVVGLRYFNVYGPGECHKKSMASVAYHWMCQLQDSGTIKLFEGCDGYADGEQRRDFVYVQDVVNVNVWLLKNAKISGIFNVGTGKSRPFNAVAEALIAVHGSGGLEYIPFPAHLRGVYQNFTEADITALRSAGYTAPFLSLEEGLQAYYRWFSHHA